MGLQWKTGRVELERPTYTATYNIELLHRTGESFLEPVISRNRNAT